MIEHAMMPVIPLARVYRPRRTRLTDPVEDQILTTLCTRTEAPRVLEIGTYLGHTTMNLARVVKPLGGKVFTIDVKSAPPSLPEVQRGEVLPEPMIGSAIPPEYRDSTVFMKLVDGNVGLTPSDLGGERFDLVFIDGDHSYSGVLRDMKAVGCCLSDIGVILFHDVWWDVTPPPVDGPLRLLSEWSGYVLNFTHLGIRYVDLDKVGGTAC